mgnify:CR=1 FL=1
MSILLEILIVAVLALLVPTLVLGKWLYST